MEHFQEHSKLYNMHFSLVKELERKDTSAYLKPTGNQYEIKTKTKWKYRRKSLKIHTKLYDINLLWKNKYDMHLFY